MKRVVTKAQGNKAKRNKTQEQQEDDAVFSDLDEGEELEASKIESDEYEVIKEKAATSTPCVALTQVETQGTKKSFTPHPWQLKASRELETLETRIFKLVHYPLEEKDVFKKVARLKTIVDILERELPKNNLRIPSKPKKKGKKKAQPSFALGCPLKTEDNESESSPDEEEMKGNSKNNVTKVTIEVHNDTDKRLGYSVEIDGMETGNNTQNQGINIETGNKEEGTESTVRSEEEGKEANVGDVITSGDNDTQNDGIEKLIGENENTMKGNSGTENNSDLGKTQPERSANENTSAENDTQKDGAESTGNLIGENSHTENKSDVHNAEIGNGGKSKDGDKSNEDNSVSENTSCENDMQTESVNKDNNESEVGKKGADKTEFAVDLTVKKAPTTQIEKSETEQMFSDDSIDLTESQLADKVLTKFDKLLESFDSDGDLKKNTKKTVDFDLSKNVVKHIDDDDTQNAMTELSKENTEKTEITEAGNLPTDDIFAVETDTEDENYPFPSSQDVHRRKRFCAKQKKESDHVSNSQSSSDENPVHDGKLVGGAFRNIIIPPEYIGSEGFMSDSENYSPDLEDISDASDNTQNTEEKTPFERFKETFDYEAAKAKQLEAERLEEAKIYSKEDSNDENSVEGHIGKASNEDSTIPPPPWFKPGFRIPGQKSCKKLEKGNVSEQEIVKNKGEKENVSGQDIVKTGNEDVGIQQPGSPKAGQSCRQVVNDNTGDESVIEHDKSADENGNDEEKSTRQQDKSPEKHGNDEM